MPSAMKPAPTSLRAIFQRCDVLAPAATGVGHRDAYIVGRILVGRPADGPDAGNEVSEPINVCVLLQSGPARLQSTVPFRDRPDAHEAALEATRTVLVHRALDRMRAVMARGGDLSEIGGEEMLADDVTELTRTTEKRCAFQTGSPAGLLCQVDSSGVPGKTSRPVCAACSLPDDRLRCTALQHPVVVASSDRKVLRRFPQEGLCDAGHQDRVGNTSDCRPGGNPCWRADLIIASSVAEPVVNAPELLIDEVKHLRLVLGERLGGRLSRGSDELGVGSTIMAPCESEEELARKVSAVMSLLESTNVAKLARQRGAIIDDEAGSIRALEQTLEHLGAEDHAAAVEALRGLQGVKSLLSHHNWDDRILALRRFGIELPTEDYGAAWLRIASGVRDALRRIRLALEVTADRA